VSCTKVLKYGQSVATKVLANELNDTRKEIYIYMDNKPTDKKPEPVTPENVKIISDDELRKQIIDGTLDDPKLETTLFPDGKPM